MLDNSEQEVKSGSNPSTGPSDDSPNSEPLSTATPGSAAISCDETKDLVPQTGAPIFVVDDSTKDVRITRGAAESIARRKLANKLIRESRELLKRS